MSPLLKNYLETIWYVLLFASAFGGMGLVFIRRGFFAVITAVSFILFLILTFIIY